MSANFPLNSNVRQLDLKSKPDEPVTEKEVKDPNFLARILAQLLKDVAEMKRRWAPKRFDYEDRAVDATGATKYRFAHGLRQRVRWWPVDWRGASAGPSLVQHADTDDNTLVLVSHVSGSVTIRIEGAG